MEADRPTDRAVQRELLDMMYERGLSYAKFARKLGAPTTTVHRVLSDDAYRINPDTIAWVATALDVRVDLALTDRKTGKRTIFLPAGTSAAPPEDPAAWTPMDLAEAAGALDERRQAAVYKLASASKKVPADVLEALVKTLAAWDR